MFAGGSPPARPKGSKEYCGSSWAAAGAARADTLEESTARRLMADITQLRTSRLGTHEARFGWLPSYRCFGPFFGAMEMSLSIVNALGAMPFSTSRHVTGIAT